MSGYSQLHSTNNLGYPRCDSIPDEELVHG